MFRQERELSTGIDEMNIPTGKHDPGVNIIEKNVPAFSRDILTIIALLRARLSRDILTIVALLRVRRLTGEFLL